MGSAKISDAEAHELVMKRIGTMTREEWQARLDAAAKVFGRDAAAVAESGRNGAHPSTAKNPKKSSAKAATKAVAA